MHVLFFNFIRMPNKEQQSHYWDTNIHAMLGFKWNDGEKTNGCDDCRIVTKKGFEHCLSSWCFDNQIFGD